MKLSVGDSVKFNISGRSYEGVIIKISFNNGGPRYTVKTETSRFGVKEIFYVFRVDENNTVVDKLNGSIKRKNPNQINGPSLYPKGDKLYNKLCQLYNEK